MRILTKFKSVIEKFLSVNTTEGDEGIICKGEFQVGQPGNGKETVLGEGDSYPVPIAFHCDVANTSGTTITNATDITEILQSNNGSTTGLFGGTSIGNYILIGSDFPFGGNKVKINTDSVLLGSDIVVEYQESDSVRIDSPFMVTNADFPYQQKGFNIAQNGYENEQWRYGFQPDVPTPVWDPVTMVINGTTYENKYWGRFRIVNAITTDPIIEQVKMHTNRFEANADGTTEYFGRSRYKKTLFSGVEQLINNTASSAANQNVAYTPDIILDYSDNQFNDNTIDAKGLILNIDEGLDTSIPVELDISYYVEGTGTGDVEFQVQKLNIADGFVYDGTATPDATYNIIDTVSVPSDELRRTVRLFIDVREAQQGGAYVLNLLRDATGGNPNDTLPNNIVITHIVVYGYFWRP